MKIQNIQIKTPFVLAPMAAVNCTSYRLLCKKHGCGLIYTQMINSNLHYNKTKEEIKKFLNIREEERPVSVQISGADKDKILKTAKLVEEFADIIDFNSGCILPDVLARGEGAALLKEQDKLLDIVKSLVGVVKKPVSVKIRIGWDDQSICGVRLAKQLKECGISALAVHGRTAQQKYGGKSNWLIQKQIKEAVKELPVIFNGDVDSYEKGLEMLEKSGCDGIMIGRKAMHSPWVFNKNFVKNNQNVLREILSFIELYERYENRKSVNEVREHVFWMMKDVRVKGPFNPKKIHQLKSVDEIKSFLKKLY